MLRTPLLFLHIAGGLVGLLSGTGAMIFRKGSRRHQLAGQMFVASMITMAASATYLAVMKHQTGNVFGGLMTLYMVTTAWLTARRKDGDSSLADWVALMVPLGEAAVTFRFGVVAMRSPGGTIGGVPAGMCFFMGAVALLAAGGDLRMLLGHALSGRQRITRHLWRMCFGLFIASGSLFMGQQQVFPKFLRGNPVMIIPAVLPLVMLVFWAVRVRVSNNKQAPARAVQAAA